MLIELKTAETEEDFLLISDLARDIWTEYYSDILEPDRIEYLLNTKHTPAAIAEEVSCGHIYSLVLVDTEPAGCLSYRIDQDAGEVFLNKFYVAAPYRGKGVGRYMLKIVENDAARHSCKKIWMVVNRDNTNGIAACEKMGFINKGELKTDIGNGYIMDDCHMVKAISFHSILSSLQS